MNDYIHIDLTNYYAGELLTDESMWEIFQTGWRSFTTATHTALLQSLARDMLNTLVMRIFARTSAVTPPPSLSFSPWGLPVMMKVTGFLITSLTTSLSMTGQKNGRTRILVMGLLRCILEEGGVSLLKCDGLRMLLQDDLCKVLIQIGSQGRFIPLLELSATLQVTQTLILSFRSHMKLQVEAMLKHVYLRTLVKPSGVSDPATELILEHLVNLTADSTFAVDLFVNYDCCLSSIDLMETMVTDLSKNVFPLKEKTLASHNWLALTGLLNCLKFILHHIDNAPKSPTNCNPESPLSLPEEIQVISERKGVKQLYKSSVHRFNEKPSDGIKALISHGLIDTPIVPSQVANFFRYTPGLEKRKVGEFLGSVSEESQAVLGAFVSTFNFAGMKLLDSLRMFLETFRLPGEAQQIDRIMQAFANAIMVHSIDASLFATVDVAYLLSFAIIMLNTDLHNPNIQEDRKMKMVDFVRLNKNYDAEISQGRDIPREYLEVVYNSIKSFELITSDGGGASEFRSEMWHDLILRVKDRDNDMIHVPASITHFDRTIFLVVWQPILTALSLAYDNTTDQDQVEEALDGFLTAARIANSLSVQPAFDSLTNTLCNFTTLTKLPPSNHTSNSVISTALRLFGLDHKAQMVRSSHMYVAYV